MTGPEFKAWADALRSDGLNSNQIAALIGVSRRTLFRMQNDGTSDHSDLAIAAVDARLKESDREV